MPVAPHIKETMNSKNSSAIRKMFEEGCYLKKQYGSENVYDFSIGNPDLSPPEQVLQSIKFCAENEISGIHGYMANAGFLETRKAMAQKVSTEQGMPVDYDCILMTSGAAAALNCVFKAILSPGDEIIVPVPFFAEYSHYIANYGGVLVPVSTKQDFSLDIESITSSLSSKTAAVLINSPNNPTGKVYSSSEIKELASVLNNHSVKCGRSPYLICDEPYRAILYDGNQVAPVFPEYNNSVIVTSFAKDLSLPGERIGYIAVNPLCQDYNEFISACTFSARVLGYVNAPAFFQRVVAMSWNSPIDYSSYDCRRKKLMQILDSVGIKYTIPQGAFYVFCQVPLKKDAKASDSSYDDGDFCEHLKKHLILCAPGTGFGLSGWFRMAYCVSDSVISGCYSQLAKAVATW